MKSWQIRQCGLCAEGLQVINILFIICSFFIVLLKFQYNLLLSGVITMDNTEPQTVTLEVMPLIAGYLPLPAVRLSKYIAAILQQINKGDCYCN